MPRKPAPSFMSDQSDQSLTPVETPADIALPVDDNPNGGDPRDPAQPAGEPEDPNNPPPVEPYPAPEEVEEQEDEAEDEAEDKPEADEEDPTDETTNPQLLAPAAGIPTGQTISAGENITLREGSVTYEARIQILDAYQYPGGLGKAPPWVDRNWVGYGDPDDLRGIPAGPCLRVPLPSGLVAICRIGDYVCRQSVTLIPGNPAEIRLEVWDQEQFQKLFVPKYEKPFRPFNPSDRPTPSAPAQEIIRSAKSTRSSKSNPERKPAPKASSRAA